MVTAVNVTFSQSMSKRLNDLNQRFKSVEQRNRLLYSICLIVFITIVTVIIVYFSCFYNKIDDNEIFDKFNIECLKSHNHYRSLHGVQPLKLHPDLISIAKGRAEYLVRTDVFEHPSYEFKFGENLHYIMPLIRNYSCHKVVKPWYDEIKDYNYANWRQSTGKIGHFTQVVWKASDKVGCAQVYSQNSKRLYTVCNYSPAGNYINRYNDNVLLPLNRTHN